MQAIAYTLYLSLFAGESFRFHSRGPRYTKIDNTTAIRENTGEVITLGMMRNVIRD